MIRRLLLYILPVILVLSHANAQGRAADSTTARPDAAIPNAPISYKVPGAIFFIRQPKSMDCWITVTAMLFSWKAGRLVTVDQAAARLGDPWKIYYDTNTGLPQQDQDNFIAKAGLKGEPPANYLLTAYLDMLRQYGPLWITTGDGFSAHARLMTGIEGNGDYDSTSFIFLNPASPTGKPETLSALKFMKEFEEEAKVSNAQNWPGNLRVQIYHF